MLMVIMMNEFEINYEKFAGVFGLMMLGSVPLTLAESYRDLGSDFSLLVMFSSWTVLSFIVAFMLAIEVKW